MSLILEALRKSEAERRRGQVPDLHTEPSPGAQPRRDGPPAWLWLALVLAAAMVLAMATWLIRSTPLGASVAAEVPLAATDPLDAGIGREPQGQRAVAQVDAAIVNTEPVRSVESAATPTAGPSSDSMLAPVPGREDRDTPAAPALATSPATAPAATSSPAARISGATASAARAADTSTTVPPSPSPSLPAAATPARAPAGAVPAATMASALPSTVSSEPRRLSDLPVDQRRQLPPLKMSMHMWAPTQRFAIIDGARVSEGDRLGDAVVEAITADGVVLAWQGQRLHLPTR